MQEYVGHLTSTRDKTKL